MLLVVLAREMVYTPGPQEETMNLYDLSIPQMVRTLTQARRWLDKAQAHAEEKKFDAEVLLSARLAPDQWHLGRQLQAITLGPQRCSALLQGLEPPMPELGQPTFASLREGIDATLEALKALKPEQFKGAEERMIPLPFLTNKGMKATDWVLQFTLPNFYFHAATAYAILRHNGVAVGKADFLGDLDIHDLGGSSGSPVAEPR